MTSEQDVTPFADTLAHIDTQESLQALTDEARAAREVRDELLKLSVIAAHQLKSPLNSITTTLSLLIGGFAGPMAANQRELLKNASKSATRGAELVSDLLRLRGLDVLTVENMVPVNAVDCLHIALDRVRDGAHAGQLELVDLLELDDPDQGWLLAEPGVVQEILYVVVENAVKYTPPGGRVTVRMFVPPTSFDLPRRELPEEVVEGQIACEVVDTGIGIPPEAWPNIFNEFYRAPNARGLSRQGTGLGLAFAERALRLLGGRLRLEPVAEGGTRALVVLSGSRHETRDASGRVVQPRTVSQRVVVIGGVTAGSKAAARIARLDPDAEVTVVERGQVLTYAGCRLPYYISGAVREVRALLSSPLGEVRDSAFFHSLKNVRTLDFTEAISVDRDRRLVHVRRLNDGREDELPYDHLVLATGARAMVPSFPGADLPGVYTIHGPGDAEAIRNELSDPRAREVVIIGGGPVGVQITESIALRGSRISMVEERESLLGMIDPQLGRLVARHIQRRGVRIHTSAAVAALEGTDRVRAVRLGDGRSLPCDFVIIAVGVRPDVGLAREAGLTIGPSGAVQVDKRQRTSDPRIYAAGDCSEGYHLITGRPTWLPQGSTASKEGRTAACNICGQHAEFPGVVGSVVMRFFDWTVGRTGLSCAQALAEGYDPVTALLPSPDRAHYLPTSEPILLRLIADRSSRKVLGMEAIGPGEVAKRLDVVATAISLGADLPTLAQLDLVYSPEHSLAIDSVLTAANVLQNKLDGLFEGITASELQRELDGSDEPPLLLDVRLPAEFGDQRLAGSLHVPLGAVRGRLHEVPMYREIVALCKTGLRAYEAALVLQHHGYRRVRVLDGGLDAWPYALEQS